MNITEIKGALGYSSMDFFTCKSKEGVATDFVAFWDDTQRVRVLMHKDTLALAPTSAELAIRAKDKVSKVSGKSYREVWLIVPTEKPTVTL